MQSVKMNHTEQPWAAFFSLETIGELQFFRENLSLDGPEHRAFARYIDSWDVWDEANGSAPFDPLAYVSKDLSCAMLYGCPCVFMGSNTWAVSVESDPGLYINKMSQLATRICAIRLANPNAIMSVSVIPEKDYIVERMFKSEDRNFALDEPMQMLRTALASCDIRMIFDEYLDGLSAYQTIDNYAYPDSHLPSENYIQVLARQLAHADIPFAQVHERLMLQPMNEYCDLVDKLSLGIENPIPFRLPNISGPEPELIAGTQSFATPLGETKQVFSQAMPIDSRKVLILGDSHSSVYTKRKLTYLNAHIFGGTDFHWNPCGIRAVVGEVPHEIITMEISQRFLFTI
jgi:hypothetical protein